MDYKYDALVYIGRFVPFHNGHLSVLKKAFQESRKVIVLVGSSGKPPSIRNPFSFKERERMILSVVPDLKKELGRSINVDFDIVVKPIYDFPYNDSLWIKQVQDVVHSEVPYHKKIGLIGHQKDHTSFYLKLFPTWESVDVSGYVVHKGREEFPLHSTEIRDLLFLGCKFNNISIPWYNGRMFTGNIIPSYVQGFLDDWQKTKTYIDLKKEYVHILEYKESWSRSPYPPTFVTADAVVVQGGHVLLVKRKEAPGEGLLALPGGFVNQTELIVDAAIRELTEETNIDVPPAILRNNIKGSRVFDHPHRSERGRTITHAFLFDLNNELARKTKNVKTSSKPLGLSKAKGGDDASDALWIPLAQVKREELFEDHFDIISEMIEEMK